MERGLFCCLLGLAQKLKSFRAPLPFRFWMQVRATAQSGRWKETEAYPLQQPFLTVWPHRLAATPAHRRMLRRGRQQSSDAWSGEVTVFWVSSFQWDSLCAHHPMTRRSGPWWVSSMLYLRSDFKPRLKPVLSSEPTPNKSLPKEKWPHCLHNQAFTDNRQQASSQRSRN